MATKIIQRVEYLEGFQKFKTDECDVWNLYGSGGLGKSTLLESFYETCEKESRPAMLLFNKGTNGLPPILDDITFFKERVSSKSVKVLIERSEGQFESKSDVVTDYADVISETKDQIGNAGVNQKIASYPIRVITEAISLSWKLLTGLFMKFFQRKEKKIKKKLEYFPEKELWDTFIADVIKNARGFIILDSMDELSGFKVKTRLGFHGEEVQKNPEPREYTFENFLTVLLSYLITYCRKQKTMN